MSNVNQIYRGSFKKAIVFCLLIDQNGGQIFHGYFIDLPTTY